MKDEKIDIMKVAFGATQKGMEIDVSARDYLKGKALKKVNEMLSEIGDILIEETEKYLSKKHLGK